jgi:hypothetical protein
MSNNISFDIETLGTEPGSVVLSIGAARFSDDEVLDTFYVNIDRQIQEDAGLTVNPNTVAWWAKQPQHARDRLLESPVSPTVALHALADWMGDIDTVWGYGSCFDIVLLESLHRHYEVPIPWKYSEIRCGRTRCADADVWPVRLPGEHHTADKDAIRQAQAYIDAMKPEPPWMRARQKSRNCESITPPPTKPAGNPKPPPPRLPWPSYRHRKRRNPSGSS